MENDLLSVIRLFFCGADVYMLHRFFAAMFQEKWKGNIRFLFGFIMAVIIFLENSLGNVTLNYLVMPLFYYTYVSFLFNTSIWNRIAYVVICFSFIAGKEIVFEFIYRLLLNFLPFYIPPWYTSGGIYFLLVEYVLGFLFLVYMERCIKKLEVRGNNIFSWYLLIFPILSLVIPSCFLFMDFPDSLIVQLFVCGSAIMLYFTNGAIFIILEKYTNVINKVKYAEFYMLKREMENEHFENILRVNERYQCYMHDMQSYFNSLRILALNGENYKIVEIINGLKGKIHEETSNVIYNESPVLNAILSERMSKAREEGIELSIFVEKFLKIGFIADADMISMFGNLLDNALEAAAKCNPENRKVDVKLFMGNAYFLIFHIENSYTVAKREGARLLSTKGDTRHHGLGIGIVMSLAEKYGGLLNLEETGDVFVTTLTISTCVEKQCANFGTQRV
ncbi:GHKL domain-containing protein [Lachnospiraceae bacterium 54-53]